MLKRISIAAIVVAIIIFIAFDLLLLWVATGPRAVPWLTPHIEKSFAGADGSYSASIGGAWLAWGGWRHPVDVRLRDVKVLTKEKTVFSSFPEISVGIDLLALPFGRVLPTSVTIDHPTIGLFQNADKSISFGFGKYESIAPPKLDQTPIPEMKISEPAPSATMIPFAALLTPLLEGGGSLSSLHRVTVKNASVSIGSAEKGVIFELANANIQAKRRRGVFTLLVAGDMLYGEHQSAIGAVFTMSRGSDAIEGNVTFQSLDPGVLGKLFIDSPMLRIFNASLSGKTSLTLDKKSGDLKRLTFDINGGGGYINSEWLSDSLPVNSSHLAGEISNNGNDIRIDALSLTVGKMELSGSGAVSLSADDAAVQAQLSLKNAQSSDIKLLWPPKLSPESRSWVIENITHGTVPQATAYINIQPGDLKKPVLPREAVDAVITLDGATIRYLPEHPPITKAGGVIHIDGVGLTADIAGGEYMQATKMSNGRLEIEDLNADNPYIKVRLDAATTARDAVEFLKLPRLQRAKQLNLNSDTAQGTAKLNASVGFYFYAPPGEDGKPGEPDITYDVTAELKDFAAPAFLNKFDIKNGNGALTVNNRAVQFKGNGNVNGASASQADVTYKFTPEDGFDTLIEVTGNAPVESAVRFGYPAMPFAKGTLGVKASLKLGTEQEESSAAIDLTNTDLNVTSLGWVKPDKEPASLEIKAAKQNERVRITSFTLSGKGIETSGSATIAKDFSSIEQLTLGKTKLGDTDLSRFDYEYANNNLRLEVSGKSLDVSAWMDDDSESNKFSFEHFPSVTFKANIEQLALNKRAGIRNLKGGMACDAKRCSSADVTGIIGEGKEFTFRILRNPKGKRQISLHAADAGAFLKAIGAFPNIEGGILSLSGDYDDLVNGSVLRGKFIITDYTVKKAPVLAKILSLASLTGVVDLLQGNGISFSKLTAPFVLQNDIVTFKKVKAYGGSIGITADGTLQFPERMMDLKGTVVPAYALNNMLGKVPLVGQILTGGGAVFAFNYRVKGKESDPDVSVNPLSILTPGFLRNLFSGGDD